MLKRKSFIEEANSKLRENDRDIIIIFLDIDGVIYVGSGSDREHQKRISSEMNDIYSHPSIKEKIPADILKTLNKYDLSAALGFDNNSLNNLRALCDKYNAKIVVSSSWREGKNLDQLKGLFSIHGLESYIIGYTPKLDYPHNRGEEIESWLLSYPEKIKSFVILDDCEFDFYKRFPDRFVECNKLFSDMLLYEKADQILQKTLSRQTSKASLCWSAIEQNSAQVREIEIDLPMIIELKILHGLNHNLLLDNLFTKLERNDYITRLSLRHILFEATLENENSEAASTDSPNDMFINKITALLKNTLMKLEYLNISNNNLTDIGKLLNIMDGLNLHIPHICLDSNPLKNQNNIAAWMKTYPKPIRIDMHLEGLGNIDKCIIDAIASNPNICLHTREDLLPSSIEQDIVSQLRSSGNLQIAKKPDDKCCIM